MKQNLASASAETWNQKNLPSNIERFGEGGGTGAFLEQLPSTAVAFMKRRQGVMIASLAILGVLGVLWYLSQND